MLPGQLWLCFPREENYTKINRRRVQKRPAGSPKWSPGGLRTALLCQLGPTSPPGPLGSRVWARSWDACGALGTVLGASSGVPGRSWAPLGGRFGTFLGLIQTIWTRSVAQREIQQKYCIVRCFGLPGPAGGVRNRSKIGPGGLLDVFWHQRSVWRALVEVHRG